LQLLIERVIVGEDSLEIRHVIPLGRGGGEPSGPGPEGPARPGDGEGARPKEPPRPRTNCGLRSDGVAPAHLPARPGDPVVGAPAVGHRDRPLAGPQDRPGYRGAAVAGDRGLLSR
jgi:hypothetical protein